MCCENRFCIYWEEHKCLLGEVTLALQGCCRECEMCIRDRLYLCAGITVLLLVALIAYIFYRGLGNITWQLLSTQRSALKGTIGILPNILFTLYTIFTALIIVLPLGIGAAISVSYTHLDVYKRQDFLRLVFPAMDFKSFCILELGTHDVRPFGIFRLQVVKFNLLQNNFSPKSKAIAPV